MREINRKFKTFRLSVPSAGAVVSLDSETDLMYEVVDGVKAITSNPNAKHGSTLNLAINDEEIFPEGFDLINITSTEDCPVDQRFYTDNGKLEIPAKGSTVKIRYTDGSNADSYPYNVSIVVTQKR